MATGKTEYTAEEIEARFNKLGLKDEAVADVKQHTHEHGVADIRDVLQKKVDDFCNDPVNIAITGQSGVGKSSLINGLRSLRPKGPGAAKVGTTETTMYVAPYPFPSTPHVILWDIPGVGTHKFPKATYIKDVGLTRFDHLVICTSTRFTENDIWMAEQAQCLAMPFYFVRTKLDSDIRNALDDGEEEEEDVIEKITDDIKTNLRKNKLPTGNVFLLCTKMTHNTIWDFPKLVEQLAKTKKGDFAASLVRAMVACSQPFIDEKKKLLENNIPTVASRAAYDEGHHQLILKEEILNYVEWFGLSDETLSKFRVSIDKLGGDLSDVHRQLQNLRSEKNNVGFWARLFTNKREKIDGRIAEKQSNKTTMMQTQCEMALREALGNCVKLALGVLEERERIAKSI